MPSIDVVCFSASYIEYDSIGTSTTRSTPDADAMQIGVQIAHKITEVRTVTVRSDFVRLVKSEDALQMSCLNVNNSQL